MSKRFLELLSEKSIKLNALARDWEDALRIGGQILVDSEGVEPSYIDAMIKMIKDIGPYIVVAPGVALGHTSSEAGVNRTCFSLLTLKEPVEFGVPENDPVDLIFSFAAPNKVEHMQALREMALFCGENENLTAIRNAETPDQVIQLLNSFFGK